ncbi:hypothetical protein EI969_05135 [Pseudomonas sp. PB101]|nr:hypothetical protein [Pseudomonas sp. PB101]
MAMVLLMVRRASHGTDCNAHLVGASLLTMVVNDNDGCLTPRGALRFIASRLAPTGSACTLANPHPTSEVGAICMLIGRDRSHGSIVRFRGPEQTGPLSAIMAFTTRNTP